MVVPGAPSACEFRPPQPTSAIDEPVGVLCSWQLAQPGSIAWVELPCKACSQVHG